MGIGKDKNNKDGGMVASSYIYPDAYMLLVPHLFRKIFSQPGRLGVFSANPNCLTNRHGFEAFSYRTKMAAADVSHVPLL